MGVSEPRNAAELFSKYGSLGFTVEDILRYRKTEGQLREMLDNSRKLCDAAYRTLKEHYSSPEFESMG